jgi:hypothetical protein
VDAYTAIVWNTLYGPTRPAPTMDRT